MRIVYSSKSNINLGPMSKYYEVSKVSYSEEYGDQDYEDDVRSSMENYGLEFLGWARAKDDYYDYLTDNGLEYGAIGEDEYGNIGLYLVVNGRLYDMKDEVEMALYE